MAMGFLETEIKKRKKENVSLSEKCLYYKVVILYHGKIEKK